MSRALAPLGARSWQPKGKEGSELASESTTGPEMEMRSWEEDRGSHRETQTGGTWGQGPSLFMHLCSLYQPGEKPGPKPQGSSHSQVMWLPHKAI